MPLTVAAVWLGPDLLLVLGLVMYELQLLRCAATGISAITEVGQVLNIIAAKVRCGGGKVVVEARLCA